MSMLECVNRSISNFYGLQSQGDGVLVNTHCLYPSNGVVQVLVRGTDTSCVVSDEWGAIREIRSAGGFVEFPDKLMRAQAKKYGLLVDSGNLHTTPVSTSELAGAIAVVANASREIAQWLFKRVKPHRAEFKKSLRDYLDDTFTTSVKHEVEIIGHSNKPHWFDNVIRIGNSTILIDPVSRDSASINSRLVANLDVKRADKPGIKQRIIYDDADDWRNADISLLTMGAPVIAFSNSRDVIQELVASSRTRS